jgi:hypothetical protein
VTLDGGCAGPDTSGNFLCPLQTGSGIQVQAGNVTISGLIIQSFPNNGISIRPGISANLTGVSILDNQISDNQFDGITVSGGPGGNQVEVDIIGNEVFTNGDDNITVFGSDSSGAGGNFIDVVISGNTIKGAKGNQNATKTGDGIRVTAGFGDNVGNNRVTGLISDNDFQSMADSAVSIIGGAANGSSSDNVMDVTISGNRAHNSGLAGEGTSYTLSAGTSFPTMSTGNRLTFAVVGNTSDVVVGPGIFVNTGNGSGQVVSGTIANNIIKNSTNTGRSSGDGIIIVTRGDPVLLPPPLDPSKVENVIIELNTIKNNEGRGIAVSGGNGANKELRNVTVSNNIVTDNFDQGIMINGGTETINAVLTGIDVLSNSVRSNGAQGILVTGGTLSANATISDLLIDGNTSNSNGTRGIIVTRGTTLSAIPPVISLAGVTNNTANSNVDDGIFISDNILGSGTPPISGNRADRNGVDGIQISSTNSTGYVLSNNTASRNAGRGITAPGNTDGGGNKATGNASCNTPGCF